MFQIALATSGFCLSSNDFWKSTLIYHGRPHIINRRLAIADQILFNEVVVSTNKNTDISDVLTTHALAYEVGKLERIDGENINQKFLLNLLDTYFDSVELLEKDVGILDTSDCGVYVSVRLILPRTTKYSKCIELVIVDRDKDRLTFVSTCIDRNKLNPLPPFPYRIELSRENYLKITLNNFEDADTNSAAWLFDHLFLKLVNWSNLKDDDKVTESLGNISPQKYCEYYNILKEKYGEPLKKIWWEKTKTEAQKFLYEEIAIAAYLICLWLKEYEAEAIKAVEFIDCGCGNGLLVYILNGEGFKGQGIDIRKRNIWDLFSEKAKLQVGIIDPESKFPNATWLIGNHSDELTPWLPIIASKSSPITNFFVLPCCPFDFNGKKYLRRNTSISQYTDYMDYIKEISILCGFDTSVDKLRIPSTKRTSIIGVRNKNSSVNFSTIRERIDDLLREKLESDNFKARPPQERVRNCTQIDQKIKEGIINDVVHHLLIKEELLTKDNGTKWNKGGAILLGELPKLLKKEDLNHLKKECGGLQTLLKNHRYIFQIEEAHVSLRLPYKLEETSKYKLKPCWYHRFHPSGCLYSDKICGYSHC